MSRQLPPRPNLDHLKKQAKALLGDLTLEDSDAKLADALHAVAREYGFPTWPALKAHVESLPQAEAVERERSPFIGTWIADLSRSARHPAQQFQAAEIRVELDGDAVSMSYVMVDESGEEQQGTSTLVVDGVEHLSPSGNGYSLTATWRGSRRIEVVSKKDGVVMDRAAYAVSDDDSELTISGPEQTVVLERRTA